MNVHRRNLVRKALKYHGPLSDGQLAWWMKHFGLKPGTTKRIRQLLTKAGEVRFAKRGFRNGHGQMVCMWELDPSFRPSILS